MMKKKAKKEKKSSRVIKMTPEEAWKAQFAGPKLTAEQMVAQARRIQRQVAQDVGLSKSDAKLATMDLPPVLEPDGSN
jgi:hypothetical protein